MADRRFFLLDPNRPRRLGVKLRLRFYQALASQLRARQPLKGSLDKMHEKLTRKDRIPLTGWLEKRLPHRRMANQLLPRALRAWSTSLAAGHNLADAMKGWIPVSERILVMAGERSERMLETFEELTNVVKQRQRIRRALAKATIYPLVLFTLLCAVLYIFGIKIVPVFEQTIPAERWHGLSYGLLIVSKILREGWYWLVGGVIGAIASMVYSLPRWSRGLRIRFDRYPPYSIYRLTEGAGFMKALQVLTGTGTQLLTALGLIAQNAAPWLRSRVEGIVEQVSRGKMLAEAMDATGFDFPDRDVVDTLLILADDKDFSKTLKGVVDDWSNNITEDIEQQAGLLLVAGVIVMGLILAMCFIALLGLTDSLSATAAGTAL